MRLIDADALEMKMYHDAFETDSDMQKWESGCWIRYKLFENNLDDAPTIEPVKHGEWELDPNGMDWNIPAWKCSECGFVANYIGVEVNGFGSNPMNWAGSNFCPNCGAKMNKEK